MLIGNRRALLGGISYIDKVLGIEPANLVGLWPQNESSGSVSLDKSVHRHHGAYTGVTLGQPGVPGMGYTSPLYDGANDYNNIYSAGLANDNLLSNHGFETAGAGDPDFWANWTEAANDGALANETVVIHEGNDAAKFTAGVNKTTSIIQAITVVAGKKYRIRIWTRGDGTNAGRYRVHDGTTYLIAQTTTGVTGAAYAAVVDEFTVPTGKTSVNVWLDCPPVDGGICYFDACEVRSMDGFLGDVGTILAWAKVSAAGAWTDGEVRYIAQFHADVNNKSNIYKNSTNNILTVRHTSGGTELKNNKTGLSETGWMVVAITWSKSDDEVKTFYDGAQLGSTLTGLGTFVGDLSSTAALLGGGTTTPTNPWSGPLGPVALWNKVLTATQIAYLSTP